MASTVALTLNENNDENINVVITTNVPTAGTPLNLTGMTLEAFVKPTAATSDTDPGVWKGTTGGGEVVITNAANGEVTVLVPASALTTSQGWWRLDVISAGKRKTAARGQLTVTDQ